MTTFKELIISCDPLTVFESLAMHYDQPCTQYAEIIDKLLEIEPTCSEYTLCLIDVEDPRSKDIYTEVYGAKVNDDERYSLSFSPWSEWLASEIHETSMAMYSQYNIVAHCLFEMTFHGFTEQSIADFKNELSKRIEDIDEKDVESFTTLDEFFDTDMNDD